MNKERYPFNHAITKGRTKCWGREQLLTTLTNDIRAGQNKSLVGPRYMGKTVILQELANRLRSYDEYDAIIEWDIGTRTPRSDDEFYSQMCSKLSKGLKSVAEESSKDLAEVDGDYFDFIENVIESLSEEGKRVLMLWDGFDKPVKEDNLTHHLWDQLRELLQYSSLSVVVATRRSLGELQINEDTASSRFWGLFGNKVPIGPFEKEDIDTILEAIEEYKTEEGAKKELTKWTGNNPWCVFETIMEIDRLHKAEAFKTVTLEIVKRAANQAAEMDRVEMILSQLLEDCSPPATEALPTLLLSGSEGLRDLTQKQKEDLISRGFAHQSAKTIFLRCRLLESHINANRTALVPFHTVQEYERGFGKVLQQRLWHFRDESDTLLCQAIENAIDSLKMPANALGALSNIRNRALTLIWKNEFENGKIIDKGVREGWAKEKETPFLMSLRKDDWRIPNGEGQQIQLLGILTGSDPNIKAQARKTSEATHAVMQAVNSFRNYGAHSDEEITYQIASLALLNCIELLNCLRENSLS